MIDIALVRRDPERVIAGLERRGLENARATIDAVAERDRTRRDALARVNELKALRNRASKEIGAVRREGGDASAQIAVMREVGGEIAGLDAVVAETDRWLAEALAAIPNLPHDSVPKGGVQANRVVRQWGSPPDLPCAPRPHWELGESLGILDLAAAAKVSGSGFTVLRGRGAALQRGLINWMIGLHTAEHGYEEVRVPYLVTAPTMTGTGQLPRFAEESYVTEPDGLWLIPTAEVPVTNLHREEILSGTDLPLKYVAYSPCFRREAGAAGRDTRGMLRVHQFDKVELVRFERPEASAAALEELTAEAARILELLGLHYRVVLLAAGDLGFSSALTYDLEVWAPGVGKWLEVSSCSNFRDFQARRARIRYRPERGAPAGFLHTLNGSGLALPRLMVALLETYQLEDGSVRLPEVLGPVLGFNGIAPAD
ncbi:MAG: serine--tRNA ligase [Gemmatimonadetes bacterium]|nr:serine--tRNA ligase [Gemmatimonadota bacterium]MYA10321.1 serine--tRNA ligase [Gemmatimonadota bacterium]MYE69641.1 serine--tRNA ligase [Gemmatimonadota bacterium]MYJ69464.1 serine--tRNA ligase [Gemmatimonadota bacterium]